MRHHYNHGEISTNTIIDLLHATIEYTHNINNINTMVLNFRFDVRKTEKLTFSVSNDVLSGVTAFRGLSGKHRSGLDAAWRVWTNVCSPISQLLDVYYLL